MQNRNSSLSMEVFPSSWKERNYDSIRFAEKRSRNIIPIDLLWEKNIIPTKKISWKVRIIREANRAYRLCATKSYSCLIKFLVNNIHIYDFKLIYNKNIFHN